MLTYIQNLSALDTYLTFAVMGFLLLLGSFVFGGDGDVDADVGDADGDAGGPSPFGLKVISVFLGLFGVGGLIAVSCGLSGWPALTLAVPVGLLSAVCAYVILRLLYSNQASTDLSDAGLPGCRGIASIDLPDQIGEGVGAVAIDVPGRGSLVRPARAYGGVVRAGMPVEVISVSGGVLTVRPVA